jgi:hypothetical protein
VDRRTLDAVRMISFDFHQYPIELFHLPQHLKKRRAAQGSSLFCVSENKRLRKKPASLCFAYASPSSSTLMIGICA